MELAEGTQKLAALRAISPAIEVANYRFQDLHGEVSLLELFSNKNKLLIIHNMGQACRYCTLWADGFNGIVSHLEAATAVVLVSKDTPETQRRFANSRQWRFRMASHGGGAYIREQSVAAGNEFNVPGVVCYERDGDRILKKNSANFGPGDLFCPFWHLLALTGIPQGEFTPQFSYWARPEKMDDGGANLEEWSPST